MTNLVLESRWREPAVSQRTIDTVDLIEYTLEFHRRARQEDSAESEKIFWAAVVQDFVKEQGYSLQEFEALSWEADEFISNMQKEEVMT